MSATSPHRPVTLLASAVRTTTSTGSQAVPLALPGGAAMRGVAFVLNVTAAATEAGDTLDVFVQTQLDGTNWVDVVAFTQVVGNGSTKRYFAKVVGGVAQDDFENATALTAGSVRNLMGRQWRVRYVVTDASTDNASFTFSVVAVPE